MARVAGAEPIYRVADLFRQRCLIERRSLLWGESAVWTPDNLSALWDAFDKSRDESDRSFFDKLRDQISEQPPDVHRVAADILALYHLFPSNIAAETKLNNVKTVISWKLQGDLPDFLLLEKAYSKGIGSGGTGYLTGRPWHFAFLIKFSQGILSGEADPLDPTSCQKLADSVESQIRSSRAARHVILHLLHPDRFERIASERHKRQLIEAFQDRAAAAEDLDDALLSIRRAFEDEYDRADFDFYDKDVIAHWNADFYGTDGESDPTKIAELLENKSLADRDVISEKGWQKAVRPITRPFLQRIADKLGTGVKFFSGRDAKLKRESYDTLAVELDGVSAVVYVGCADNADGNLEQQLSWGLHSWGAADSAEQRIRAAESLSIPGFTLRAIDGIKASGFGGTTVVLFRSRSAEELRGLPEDELVGEIADDLKTIIAKASAPVEEPRVWIEKTIVHGRPHRQSGEHALGKVLWSPQHSRGGGDIYHFMRDVKEGDIVLHLTDNEAFAGMSIVGSPAEDFAGVANSEWGEGDSYLVRLRDFERLDPPLSREVVFESPYREQLVALLEEGEKNLFYNRGPSLNQGAHLTPAPTALVAILNDAYRQVAGRPLVELTPPKLNALLVGTAAYQEKHALLVEEQLQSQDRATSWWHIPITGDRERVLIESGYVYLYRGQPGQELTHRYHVVDHSTTSGNTGIACPWPEFAQPELLDRTSAGPDSDEVFKTWLLIDRVEELDPPIDLS